MRAPLEYQGITSSPELTDRKLRITSDKKLGRIQTFPVSKWVSSRASLEYQYSRVTIVPIVNIDTKMGNIAPAGVPLYGFRYNSLSRPPQRHEIICVTSQLGMQASCTHTSWARGCVSSSRTHRDRAFCFFLAHLNILPFFFTAHDVPPLHSLTLLSTESKAWLALLKKRTLK